MSLSISYWQDDRYPRKKTPNFPIKLLVVYEREPVRYQLKRELTTEEYNLVSSKEKVSKKLQDVRQELNRILGAAISAANELKPFNFRDFENSYIRNNPDYKPRKFKPKKEDPVRQQFDYSPFEQRFKILKEVTASPEHISSLYIEIVKKLIKRKKIGNAINYQDSYNSLKMYFGDINILHLNEEALFDYEEWMLKRGRKLTTVGIKLRHLRAVYNLAIVKGIAKDNSYPFGIHKYLIPAGSNIKKALHDTALKALYDAEPLCEKEKRAKCYWFFQYFGNGMNPKDCAKLKYENIEGRIIKFQRAKTENTLRSTPKTIIVYMNDDMLYCMGQLAGNNKKPTDYIFPILEDGMSDLDQHFRIKAFAKFVNHWMTKICLRLELPALAKNQHARHSLATKLMRLGASTEFIKDVLGHENVRTTEKYLGGFDYEVIKEYAEKTAQFSNRVIAAPIRSPI